MLTKSNANSLCKEKVVFANQAVLSGDPIQQDTSGVLHNCGHHVFGEGITWI